MGATETTAIVVAAVAVVSLMIAIMRGITDNTARLTRIEEGMTELRTREKNRQDEERMMEQRIRNIEDRLIVAEFTRGILAPAQALPAPRRHAKPRGK